MRKLVIKCKHGVILYGTRCLNCEREKKKNVDAAKAVLKRAEKLKW